MLAYTLPRTDSSRLIWGIVISVIIHGFLVLLIPPVPEREEREFELPLYIALAEPPSTEPVPIVPEIDVPPAVPSPAPTPTPAPEALPPVSGERPAPSAPGTPDVSESTPVAPPQPLPQPLPPRTRSTDAAALRTQATDGTIPVDTQAEVAQFYRWVSERQQQLSEYDARQRRREDATGPTDAPATTQEDSDLQAALRQFIQNITTRSDNVVTASPGPGDPDTPGPSGEPSGVTVGGPGGPRRRTSGGAPSLAGLNLPPGFPPAYAVHVTFRVSPQGQVVRSTVIPPTPYPELDRRITAAVDQWRFEPASDGGSSVVEGSVTILVDTSVR